MSTLNVNDIMLSIYQYYPRYISYSKDSYQMSTEYSLYKKITNDKLLRETKNTELLTEIKKFVKDYCISIGTQTDYPSLHYSILLHEGHPILDDDEELLISLNGRRLDFELYISLLSNYYYYFTIETTIDMDKTKLMFRVLFDSEILLKERDMISQLQLGLYSLGYEQIKSDIAHIIVPDVETELKYSNEASIFNCLFSDLIDNY